MTVHSAKGLEFHAVFISGLEEGLFPHENSLNEDDGLEEERRLMYVALTRARRRLYLSFAQNRMLHGQTRYNVASRFLDEIPEELVKCAHAGCRTRKPFDVLSPAPRQGAQAVAAHPRRAGSTAHRAGWRIGQNVVHAKFGRASSSTPRAAARTRACRSTSAARA